MRLAEINKTKEVGKSPLWFRIFILVVMVAIASILMLVIFSTIEIGVPPSIFYTSIITLGILTSTPIFIAYWRRYWSISSAPPPVQALKTKQVVKPKPAEEEARAKQGIFSRINALFARPVSERTRLVVIIVTIVLVLTLILTATFVYPTYFVRPQYDNFMVVIFIAGLFPPSLLDLIDRRYRRLIDSRIPDFLREIGDSQRTGLPFMKSLVSATESNYGPLSIELKRAMAKMSWGFTFEDALDAFADGAKTALAHRAAVLLKEVGRSGGKMLEVLDSVYEHIREVISLQRERSKQLTPYIMVIYASFGVYLFVVYILFTTFFAQVANLQQSGAPFGSNINPQAYYIWFFHMSIVEAVFGGLVAGKIATGASVAGLKHMLVLLTISFIVFSFFITF
jgi:pilus assembly protein TadC